MTRPGEATHPLDRDEYVEQAHLFRLLRERMLQNQSTQDLLPAIREELLSTTRLPLAVDFMSAELRHQGVFGPAMRRLSHYFTPFQVFVIGEAESERGRLDFQIALEILEREALYKSEGGSRQGLFFFQFESLCRNRLGYDRGLEAVARDPAYEPGWSDWIQTVRRQVGLVDFADLVYVRSQYYLVQKARRTGSPADATHQVLFGDKEGKIAWANRKRDPLYLFAALARHLGYPTVPRQRPPDELKQHVPAILRRLERLESQVKLLEEEAKGGIDLTRLYRAEDVPPWDVTGGMDPGEIS
jgi:hypothetical protein